MTPLIDICFHAVLFSLFDAARQAQASQDVKAIVVTGANGRFSAGFDIAQFQKNSGGGGVDMRYALMLSDIKAASSMQYEHQSCIWARAAIFWLHI